MNIFSDRLPRPRGGWASAQPFLQMTEEEYRTRLKEGGHSDHFIEQELRQLHEARERYGLPGPAKPEAEETAGGGPVDRAAERRREGGTTRRSISREEPQPPGWGSSV